MLKMKDIFVGDIITDENGFYKVLNVYENSASVIEVEPDENDNFKPVAYEWEKTRSEIGKCTKI